MGHWDELHVESVPGQSGRYWAQLSNVWRFTVALQGGVVAALGVRAMQAMLDDPSQTLRTATTVFAAPVTAGPLEIDVTVVRRGRTMSQLSATVRNAGAPAGLTMVAAFGAARQGFAFTELTPPDVPLPDDLPSFRDPLPEGIDFEWDRDPFPFWEQVMQSRPAIGRRPWEPWDERPAEVANWYRFDEPPLTDSGELDVAGLVVMGDTMPGSIGQKVPPVDSPWFAPSVDYTLHVLGDAHPDWLLAHMCARHAGDGYASIDAALWDMRAQPRLVAYATQLCLFSFGP